MGRLVASSGWDNAIRVWDTVTEAEVQILRDPDGVDTVFTGVAWSPDGKFLASGTSQQGVYVWEMATLTRLWIGQKDPAAWIRRVAWSPDGMRLASGGVDGSVCLWQACDGTRLHRLQGHRGIAASVAWSSDGTRLASCGGGRGSGEIFVWQAHSGERLYALEGLVEIISTVAWHPVGDRLISGGSDGRLRWWICNTGSASGCEKPIRGPCRRSRSVPMAAGWPVAAMMGPSRSGTSRVASICIPCAATGPTSASILQASED